MYIRKQILENQKKFRKEIVAALKLEFREMKKELDQIQTADDIIKEEKIKLLKRVNKIKIVQELEKFFISEKNLYPKYYAWWDEINNQVIKHKYIDK